MTFTSDALSATIVSSKGISHYDVVLCSGAIARVEVSGEVTTLRIGGFGSPIVSVTVKSGTTTSTFTSGVDCTVAPPPDHHTPTPPVDHHHTGATTATAVTVSKAWTSTRLSQLLKSRRGG